MPCVDQKALDTLSFFVVNILSKDTNVITIFFRRLVAISKEFDAPFGFFLPCLRLSSKRSINLVRPAKGQGGRPHFADHDFLRLALLWLLPLGRGSKMEISAQP